VESILEDVTSVLTLETIAESDERSAVEIIKDRVQCQGKNSPQPGAVDVVFKPRLFPMGEENASILQPTVTGWSKRTSTHAGE